MPREENRRALLEMMPKGAVCAEIGVWDGFFSAQILEITQPRRLHLVDPWLFQPEFNNSAFGRDANSDAMEEKFLAVQDRFAGDERVVIHRCLSHEALAEFGNGELDWVYLDGNHNYEVVAGDLALSLDKVRADGIIAGDDFFWRKDKGAPVRTAVREAVARLGEAVRFSRMGQQYILDLSRG